MRMEQIALLINQTGIARSGIDLFIHTIPAEVISGVMIMPSLAGSRISFELPGFRKDAGFQIICRDAQLADAQMRAYALLKVLTITKRTLIPGIPSINSDQSIPAVLLSYIRPLHDPQPYPRQPSKAWEVSTNFFASYAIQDSPYAV